MVILNFTGSWSVTCRGYSVWCRAVFSDRHKGGNCSILWELCKSSGVDGYTQRLVVFVVGDQPLQGSLNYFSSDTEVSVGLIGSFSPYNNDIQVRRQPGKTLSKGGHILWQVDHMSTVAILSMRQFVDGHDRHHCRD